MATSSAQITSSPVAAIKNILFATDFSEPSMHAFPYVAALAKKFGASVCASHVITPSSLAAAAPEGAAYLYEAEYNSAEQELSNIRKCDALQGIKTKTLLSSGMLGDVLLEEVKQNQIDLIIAGTHGRTGVRRFVLGSAAETICRVAPCPVLIAGNNPAPGEIKFKRILFPTDLSEESLRILPIVVRLATEYGATVTVLHVLSEEPSSSQKTRKSTEPVYAGLAEMFGSHIPQMHAEFMIEKGETVQAVLNVAHQKKADLIAMGIKSASFSALSFKSSKAYRIIAASQCPVITCR